MKNNLYVSSCYIIRHMVEKVVSPTKTIKNTCIVRTAYINSMCLFCSISNNKFIAMSATHETQH